LKLTKTCCVCSGRTVGFGTIENLSLNHRSTSADDSSMQASFLCLARVCCAGNERADDLISPAIHLVNSALSLLVRTDGDLAGWLGDLAPRGDLDSTQLLYRIFGVDVAGVYGVCKGQTVHNRASHSAVTCLTSQGLPVLSLAFRMLSPAASTAARSSKGSGDGTAQGSANSTDTASGGGRAEAGSKGADKTGVGHCSSSGSGKQQQPGRSGSSRTALGGRVGPSFIEAWTESPLTVKKLTMPCRNLRETDSCLAQVRHRPWFCMTD
jgi:hypothetical protein